MTQSAITEAARRGLKSLTDQHPARITVAGKTIAGAAIETRGMMEDAKGGFVQGRKVRCMLPKAALAESDVMDSTTGVVKRQSLTVAKGTASQAYRVKRVNIDPTGTYWTIEGEQAVV